MKGAIWSILLAIFAVTAVLGQTVIYIPDDNPNPPFDQTSVDPTLTITETITNSASSTVVTVVLPNQANSSSFGNYFTYSAAMLSAMLILLAA